MSVNPDPQMGVNSWLEEELYHQYLRDRSTVDESWKEVFDSGGATAAPAAKPGGVGLNPPTAPSAPEPPAGGQLQPLRGAAVRIAENMAASVSIPLATSQRTIAVKVMDENRRIINQHRALLGASKVSYTHLIGWALVKALEDMPGLNQAYAEQDGAAYRVIHPHIHLGIAVDAAGKDGAHNLLVPNIKDAGTLNFEEYLHRFDDLVARARGGNSPPRIFRAPPFRSPTPAPSAPCPPTRASCPAKAPSSLPAPSTTLPNTTAPPPKRAQYSASVR